MINEEKICLNMSIFSILLNYFSKIFLQILQQMILQSNLQLIGIHPPKYDTKIGCRNKGSNFIPKKSTIIVSIYPLFYIFLQAFRNFKFSKFINLKFEYQRVFLSFSLVYFLVTFIAHRSIKMLFAFLKNEISSKYFMMKRLSQLNHPKYYIKFE